MVRISTLACHTLILFDAVKFASHSRYFSDFATTNVRATALGTWIHHHTVFTTKNLFGSLLRCLRYLLLVIDLLGFVTDLFLLDIRSDNGRNRVVADVRDLASIDIGSDLLFALYNETVIELADAWNIVSRAFSLRI